MPTVKGIPGPYRLFFYSFDCGEPEHVHVRRDDATCKFWIAPLALASNSGFTPKHLNSIRSLIDANLGLILEAWNEHCN